MDTKTRVHETERYWLAIIVSLITIVILNSAFVTWRVLATSAWLQYHMAYVRERDSRWEPFMESIESHLKLQDEHLIRQDAAVETVTQNQSKILERINANK